METRLAASPNTHRVQPGDTVSRIARRYGVSASALVKHNGIADPDSLQPGQVLKIPGKGGAKSGGKSKSKNRDSAKASRRDVAPSRRSGGHTVKPGETLSRIAREHGVSVNDLLAWNGITDPTKLRIGQTLSLGGARSVKPTTRAVAQSARPTGTASFVIRPGDTLSSISRAHGVTVQQLIELNGISDPTRLAVGQSLALGTASAPAPSTVAVIARPASVEATGSVALAAPVEAFKSLVSGRPSHSFRQHTVRPGDTLHSISKENNLSVEDLRAANGLGQSNFIRDGQQLRIPNGDSAPVAPVAVVGRESIIDLPELEIDSMAAPAVTKPLFEVPEITVPNPPTRAGRQQSDYFGFAPTPSSSPQSSEYLAYTIGPKEDQPRGADQPVEPERIETVAELFSTTPAEIRKLNNLGPDEEPQLGAKIIVPAGGLFGH